MTVAPCARARLKGLASRWLRKRDRALRARMARCEAVARGAAAAARSAAARTRPTQRPPRPWSPAAPPFRPPSRFPCARAWPCPPRPPRSVRSPTACRQARNTCPRSARALQRSRSRGRATGRAEEREDVTRHAHLARAAEGESQGELLVRDRAVALERAAVRLRLVLRERQPRVVLVVLLLEAASTPLGGGRVEHAVGDLEPRLLPGHELDHPFPDWVGAPRLAHAAASAAAAAPLRRAAAAEQVCRRRGPVAAAARSGRLTRRRGRALYTVEALATMDGCARSHRVCFVVQPLQRDEPASLVAPARRSRDRVGESIDRLARLARGG